MLLSKGDSQCAYRRFIACLLLDEGFGNTNTDSSERWNRKLFLQRMISLRFASGGAARLSTIADVPLRFAFDGSDFELWSIVGKKLSTFWLIYGASQRH
jgi:hypothetical protein